MKRTLIYLLFFIFLPSTSYSGDSIFAVKSRDIEQLNSAFSGTMEVLRTVGLDPDVRVFNLAGDEKQWDEVLTKIRDEKPRLIITFGTFATVRARRDVKNIPVVFSNVLNPEDSNIVRSLSAPGENVSGASLDVPPEVQFYHLLKIVPSAKKIGVLYNPAETGQIIQKARNAANEMGLELIAEPVTSIDELPDSIKRLLKKVDVLWSVADGTILSRTTISKIIYETINHKVPFMGLSPYFVQAGALFSLSIDDADIGRQAGEIAVKAISGNSIISKIPVATPRKVNVSINLKTAKAIDLAVPAATLKTAEVIK